jgi:mannose-6-phosphate isomerase-like protein (cupin superfamily)
MSTVESKSVEAKSFDSPDEVRPFKDHGQVQVLQLHGKTVMRGTYDPGWRWSNDVKPMAGTDSCQTKHFGYVVSGRMKIYMDDGTELECGPGDLVAIEPGHDAEVVGNEPCSFIDFGDVAQYAKAR